jgi:hypothetical protein
MYKVDHFKFKIEELNFKKIAEFSITKERTDTFKYMIECEEFLEKNKNRYTLVKMEELKEDFNLAYSYIEKEYFYVNEDNLIIHFGTMGKELIQQKFMGS